MRGSGQALRQNQFHQACLQARPFATAVGGGCCVRGAQPDVTPSLHRSHPPRRLDKPVSGLLLFARSAAAAAALCRKIEGREVEKVYVARVLGRFPGEKALGEDLSMVCVCFVCERLRVRVPVRVHQVGQVWPDREIS